jgi:hypothetical protein
VLSERYAEAKVAAPHTWHAAEAFLCLLDVNVSRVKSPRETLKVVP